MAQRQGSTNVIRVVAPSLSRNCVTYIIFPWNVLLRTSASSACPAEPSPVHSLASCESLQSFVTEPKMSDDQSTLYRLFNLSVLVLGFWATEMRKNISTGEVPTHYILPSPCCCAYWTAGTTLLAIRGYHMIHGCTRKIAHTYVHILILDVSARGEGVCRVLGHSTTPPTPYKFL